MNKVLKIAAIALGVLAVGAAGVYWLLPRGLNTTVKTGIETVGTLATATPVTVQSVNISPWTGRGEIRGLAVANPDGFDTDYAFELGRVFIHLDLGTLGEEVVVIHEITIDGARLSAEQKLIKRNNLLDILGNVQAFAGTSDEELRWPTNFVVEAFNVVNTRITVHAPLVEEKHVDLPDVHVSDIGHSSVGVSVPELPLRLLEPVIAEALRTAQRRALGF